MNPILAYKLKRLGRRGTPSKDFVNQLNQTLFARMPAKSKKDFFAVFSMRFAAILSSIILVLGTSTAAYAYSSDDVTPDSPLYPVRQAVETAEETVAITPTWKAAVVQKHLERRIKEIEVMKKRLPDVEKNDEANQVLDRVESALKTGIDKKENAKQVGERVKIELDKTDRSKLRPMQRRRLDATQNRLERALRLQKR